MAARNQCWLDGCNQCWVDVLQSNWSTTGVTVVICLNYRYLYRGDPQAPHRHSQTTRQGHQGWRSQSHQATQEGWEQEEVRQTRPQGYISAASSISRQCYFCFDGHTFFLSSYFLLPCVLWFYTCLRHISLALRLCAYLSVLCLSMFCVCPCPFYFLRDFLYVHLCMFVHTLYHCICIFPLHLLNLQWSIILAGPILFHACICM